MNRLFRAHLTLFVCVATLTMLVLWLGRKTSLAVPGNSITAASLNLRRDVSLAIGQSTNPVAVQKAVHPPGAIVPIPLPEAWAEMVHVTPTPTPRPAELDEPSSSLPDSEPAPMAAPAPPCVSPPKSVVHRVVEGETLEGIAEQYLGDRTRLYEIFDCNRDQLTHPDVLPLGAMLRIPPQWHDVSPAQSSVAPISPIEAPQDTLLPPPFLPASAPSRSDP